MPVTRVRLEELQTGYVQVEREVARAAAEREVETARLLWRKVEEALGAGNAPAPQ
ncbi:MAG: hypothetical protein M3433_00665 [Actinomycetota bacterium]|nr:hypothetical protein [Actinomycetota bacterium]